MNDLLNTGAESPDTTSRQAALLVAARESLSADQFIGRIQHDWPEFKQQGESYLIDALMDWEQSTPENQKRFRWTGWFGIASTFWHETAASHLSNSATNTATLSPKQ